MNNLVMDFYELTMGQAYFNSDVKDEIAYFDVFFRKVPDGGSFVIANGIHKCLDYLVNFKLTEDDIEYLKSLKVFSDDYLTYLSTLRFTGDVYSVKEGTVVLPNEPIMTIKAPMIEAQLVETALLLLFNHNSLIATKASRIVRAAKGKAVMEFGTRRAQGESAAIDGAYTACLVGAKGTACTESGKKFNVPVLGTMAHSFIQSFDNEYEAFKAYAKSFPDNCILLLDTYDTLNSGLPNAIRTYHEILKPMGKTLKGIRIDSGDLSYLTHKVREALDKEGLVDTKITVSNSLDEMVISSLLDQGAPIDSFGVGEKLITAASDAILDGVYKLVAVEKNGEIKPKIKISNNIDKITNPHFKKIYRIYDKNGMLITDLLSIYNEKAPSGKLELEQPHASWVRKTITEYSVRDLKLKMIENGKLIYKYPSFEEEKEYIQKELNTLWKEAKRLEFPHTYLINLSNELKDLKNKLLHME